MRIEVEISDTQGHMKVDRSTISALVRTVLSAEQRESATISIALVDNATIHAVNRTHLRHDWPTDVISFPLSDPDDAELAGELVVSAEMALSCALERNVEPLDELALYVVHGLLHLCGYDDKSEADVLLMRDREHELLADSGLKNPFSEARRVPSAFGASTVVGLTLGWMLAMGVPTLALHVVVIAMMKALQSYSRSLLEERCADRGHASRADDVSHHDHRTERSAEALAVLTGLLLAALVGVGMDRIGTTLAVEMVLLPVLLIGLLGYVIAGVIGKVFAETILDAIWPAAAFIRALASPLTVGLRLVEHLVEWAAGPSQSSPRPASLELEIPSEDETTDEDSEPEIPRIRPTLVAASRGHDSHRRRGTHDLANSDHFVALIGNGR